MLDERSTSVEPTSGAASGARPAAASPTPNLEIEARASPGVRASAAASGATASSAAPEASSSSSRRSEVAAPPPPRPPLGSTAVSSNASSARTGPRASGPPAGGGGGGGGRPQLEGAAVGAELEEPAQLARTGDGADARGHGAGGGEQREAVGADQRLADLAADARAVALVDERLEGGLGCAVAAAHAQRVAGAVEGPVRRLEVLVEQPPVAGRSEREAEAVSERGCGALGGGVVVDLELPLELEVVAPLRRAWGVVLDQVLRV